MDYGHPIAKIWPARGGEGEEEEEGEGEGGKMRRKRVSGMRRKRVSGMRRKRVSGIHIDMGGVGEDPPMVKEQVEATLALSFVASQPVPQQEPSQPLVFQDVVTTSWTFH